MAQQEALLFGDDFDSKCDDFPSLEERRAASRAQDHDRWHVSQGVLDAIYDGFDEVH